AFRRVLSRSRLDGLPVLAAGAAVDGDLARLRLGHLGHAQGEHALLDVRLDAVRVDAARHRHGTAELTARHTAEPVPAVVVLGPGDAPADRHLPPLHADVEAL